ncbi:MAG: class I SAM-dependent methyltransferase [Rhizobiaceae bacterium]
MSEELEEDSGHFAAAYTVKTQAETKDFYSSWAETYDKEVGEDNAYAQPGRATEMLLRYSQDRHIRILDAGCGSGLSGVALKHAGFRDVDGCDFSPEMLTRAKTKACYQNLFEADLNKGQVNIKDATYGAITCVGVFSFGHVAPNACDDLIRLLKPRGFLIIALNEQYWEKGDLSDKIDAMVANGTVRLLAKEFGDHLPGHGVMGWVLALEKL